MLAAEVPSPLKGLLRSFAPMLSKPQQDNLARIVVGFIAHEGEKYVANVSDSFVPHKDQSSLNRFVTDAKWDYHELNERRMGLVEDELGLRDSKECVFIIDDTNVERYGGEGVGYHHDSKHGLIKGHNYVTSVSVCNGVTYPIDIRLYASEVTSTTRPFRTKVELACEMIDGFEPPSKSVVVEFDEWYLCGDIVKHVEDRGFHWMGEARNNRIIFYNGERFHVSDILDGMRKKFVDVEVDGELYQCLQVDGYMPKIGEVRLLINCKADTKDIHFLCTDTKRPAPQLLKKGLERARIESFH
ncbi:MAG: transposase [Nitrososphaerota archaeon]|nr:transposase [Nitrososphaerota archaeon]